MSSARRPTSLEIEGCERFDLAHADSLRRRWAGLGLALFALGILWAAQLSGDLDIGRWWPIGVVAAGITMMPASTLVRGQGGEWVLLLGAAVATTGAILAYQVLLDRWESWAYAWPLVLPGSIGVGAVLGAGMRRVPDGLGMAGARLIVIGLYLWLVGFLFFEGVLGVGGLAIHRRWSIIGPLALIVAGLVLIGTRWPPATANSE